MEGDICVMCGENIGALKNRKITSDNQILCMNCSLKGCPEFPFKEYTLKEFYTHLDQITKGFYLYNTLFKDRINLKQAIEGSPLKIITNKKDDNTIKRFGVNREGIWAVEDYGLILIRDVVTGLHLIPTESDVRYLVYRYSELVSYNYRKKVPAYNVGEIQDYDAKRATIVPECIDLNFNGPHIPTLRTIDIGTKGAYKIFDKYFGSIINSSKSEWDRKADFVLKRT